MIENPNFPKIEIPELFDEIIIPGQNISFDFDGVLGFSAFNVVANFNKRFGTNYKPHDIENWYSIKDWVLKLGMTEEEAQKLNYEIWTNPEVVKNSPAVKGGLNVFRYLKKKGFDPCVITVRNPRMTDVTLDNLSSIVPELPREKIFIRESVEPDDSSGKLFKVNTIKTLNIDWHFEDSAEVINMILEGTKAKVIHIVYPGEKEMVKPSNRVLTIPVDSWHNL
jgi:uncharacterized HAD superfamily protein